MIVTTIAENDPVAEIQEITFYRTISKYPVLRKVKLFTNGCLLRSSGGEEGVQVP